MSERLEEIKEHFAYCMDEGLLFAEQEEKLLEGLYEQAERVKELESKKNEFKKWWQAEARYNNELIEQNKRYRKAILMALSDIDDHDFVSVRTGLRQALEESE